MYPYVKCFETRKPSVRVISLLWFIVNRHHTILVGMDLSKDFQLIVYFSYLENVHKSSALIFDFDEIWTGCFSRKWTFIAGRNLMKSGFWLWFWYSQYKKAEKKTWQSQLWTIDFFDFFVLGLSAKPFVEKVSDDFTGGSLETQGRIRKSENSFLHQILFLLFQIFLTT